MTSEYIKECREKLKLSQTEFAKKIDVSISTVKKWESGKSEPLFHNQKKILSLIKYYNVSRHNSY